MVGATIGSQVLLVGDTGPRLEGELAVHGLAFAKANTANDAVARMKTTRFPFVVVSPILADMGGVDFIHGVLRHFDASVVLYGNGVESSEINALLRTGRVAHFPGNVEGHAIADFLARRAGTATPPPTPRPSSSPPVFNLTPGPPPATTPQPSLGVGLGPPVASPSSFQGASSMFANAIPSSPTYAQGNPFAQGAAFGGASVPRPPTIGPTIGLPTGATPAPSMTTSIGVDHQLQQRFEAMADELARTNAELVSTRTKMAALDQEKSALLVEVEAARRSAMADVAQVMALSDEGAAIDTELEELKGQVATLLGEAARSKSELEHVRAERERVTAEQAETAGKLAEARAAREAAEAQLSELKSGNSREAADAASARVEVERLRAQIDEIRLERNSIMEELNTVRGERDVARADVVSVRAAAEPELHELRTKLAAEADARAGIEAMVALERNARQEAEGNLTRFRVESEEKWTKALAEESERGAAAEERVEALEKQRGELAAALAAAEAAAASAASSAAQSALSPANSEVEAALRTEIEKLRGDVAGARTDATTVRLDLQEALLRLDEASTALANMTFERDTLRDEAGPLRDWGNMLVADHARQQGELERMKLLNDVVAKQQASIVNLEKSLKAARDGKPAGGDVEVVVERSRKLADLVRALEPFMWGLTQATTFYKDLGANGGEAHLRSLQQLQGVLLRLRDEIAMLDLG